MNRYRLHQEQEDCIGCQSCTVACKTAKKLTTGPLPNQVITVGPHFVDGLPRAAYIFLACFHCDDPVCVTVCPSGAMHKRAADGIVVVDHDLCHGCKACLQFCPWGAIQWNPESGQVVKCDLCLDRLRAGLQPLCVTVCTTHCLHLELEEVASQNLETAHPTLAQNG